MAGREAASSIYSQVNVSYSLAGRIMEEIWPDEKLRAQYILKNPITRIIQCAPVYSENEVRHFVFGISFFC